MSGLSKVVSSRDVDPEQLGKHMQRAEFDDFHAASKHGRSFSAIDSPRHELASFRTPNMGRQGSNLSQVTDRLEGYSFKQATGRSSPGSDNVISSLIQEKERELASMASRRAKVAETRLQELEESAAGKRAEAEQLRAQLRQLSGDFKYNLKLLSDRDAELEMLEAQAEGLKEASAKREQALAEALAAAADAEAKLKASEAEAAHLAASKAADAQRWEAAREALERQAAEAARAAGDAHAARVDALSDQLRQAQDRLEAHGRDAAEERRGLVAELRQQSQRAEALAEQLQQEKGARQACEEERTAARKEVEALRVDLQRALESISGLEGEHTRFAQQASALCTTKDETIKELEAKEAELRAAAAERELKLSEASHALRDATAREADLIKATGALECTVQQLREQLASSDAALKASQKMHDAHQQLLNHQVTGMEERVAALLQQCEAGAAEIDRLRLDAERASQDNARELEVAYDRVAAAEARLKESEDRAERQILSLQQSVDAAYAREVALRQEHQREMEAVARDCEGRIAELEAACGQALREEQHKRCELALERQQATLQAAAAQERCALLEERLRAGSAAAPRATPPPNRGPLGYSDPAWRERQDAATTADVAAPLNPRYRQLFAALSDPGQRGDDAVELTHAAQRARGARLDAAAEHGRFAPRGGLHGGGFAGEREAEWRFRARPGAAPPLLSAALRSAGAQLRAAGAASPPPGRTWQPGAPAAFRDARGAPDAAAGPPRLASSALSEPPRHAPSTGDRFGAGSGPERFPMHAPVHPRSPDSYAQQQQQQQQQQHYSYGVSSREENAAVQHPGTRHSAPSATAADARQRAGPGPAHAAMPAGADVNGTGRISPGAVHAPLRASQAPAAAPQSPSPGARGAFPEAMGSRRPGEGPLKSTSRAPRASTPAHAAQRTPAPVLTTHAQRPYARSTNGAAAAGWGGERSTTRASSFVLQNDSLVAPQTAAGERPEVSEGAVPGLDVGDDGANSSALARMQQLQAVLEAKLGTVKRFGRSVANS